MLRSTRSPWFSIKRVTLIDVGLLGPSPETEFPFR